MHFIFDLIRKIILGKKNNKKLSCGVMDFQKIIHVRDFIKSMLKLLGKKNKLLILDQKRIYYKRVC